MAHHKSALKRIRQTAKKNLRNRSLRSHLRTTIKKFRTLLESGEKEQVTTAYSNVQKTLDKSVTKGILHARTAARHKSRLMQAVNKKFAKTSS